MKYTQIPVETFKSLQMNAGILVDSFTPDSGEIGTIIGATSGGINITATPTFSDMGEDIDNCPKNMLELKHLDEWEIKASGTFVTADASMIQRLAGAADESTGKITFRNDVLKTDFKDLWWIGDYSDQNTGTNAGFIAVHMMNTLSTGGFQIQSGDNAKGQFSFEFTAHYSMDAQDTVPIEVLVKVGAQS